MYTYFVNISRSFSITEAQMKAGKIMAAILAASMAVPFCACKRNPDKETETSPSESATATTVKPTDSATEPTVTETEPSESETAPTSVEDQSSEPLIIYGYDKEFGNILKDYLVDVEFVYEYVEPDEYIQTLNEALQSEEQKPDLFMMDKDNLGSFSESGKTMDMDSLGIPRSELYDQFAYTYQVAVDADNKVKALAFELAPSVIIYNRALAKQALGVYEPSDVSAKFSDWRTILDYAHDVNINSEGAVKLLEDREQLHDVYWAGHTEPWVKDGKIAVGTDFDQYILLQESLFAESLTAEQTPFSREWASDINTEKTVLFFGSLQTAADVIGYVPGHEEKQEADNGATETTSDNADATGETSEAEPVITGWGIVPAPSATYDGGTWLMVASTCEKKATAAHVLRILTLDKDTLTDLAVKGYFVNSRSIMKRCAEDPNFISDFLCGQNPYALLVPEAEKIQISSDPLTDRYADSEIKRLLDAYLAGDILTPEELKEQFVIGMEELLGLS